MLRNAGATDDHFKAWRLRNKHDDIDCLDFDEELVQEFVASPHVTVTTAGKRKGGQLGGRQKKGTFSVNEADIDWQDLKDQLGVSKQSLFNAVVRARGKTSDRAVDFIYKDRWIRHTLV